jgi:hypothetical protein
MIIHPMNKKHCEIGIENTIMKIKSKRSRDIGNITRLKKRRRPDYGRVKMRLKTEPKASAPFEHHFKNILS